jgi:alanyl-tRNA synthetase
MGWGFPEEWGFRKQRNKIEVIVETENVEEVKNVEELKKLIDDLRQSILEIRRKLNQARKNSEFISYDALKEDDRVHMELLSDAIEKLRQIADPKTDDVDNYITIFTEDQTKLLMHIAVS